MLDKIKNIKTIDTEKDSIVDYIEIIDPIKGKISGVADQELRYKSLFDPAIYSIGLPGVSVDTTSNWLDEHVGELWWDLSSIKYTWYEQGELEFRKNNWNVAMLRNNGLSSSMTHPLRKRNLAVVRFGLF